MRARHYATALAATGLLLTACGGGSTNADWTTGKDVLDALDANGFTCSPPSSGEQVENGTDSITGQPTVTVTCAENYIITLIPSRQALFDSIASSDTCGTLDDMPADDPVLNATLVLTHSAMIAAPEFPATAQPADFIKAFGGEETTLRDVVIQGCADGDPNAEPATESADADSPNAGIESALRDAATAMETAYTDTGTYPNDLATAGYSPEGDVDVVIESADDMTYCLAGATGDTVLFLDGATGEVSDQPCA